MRIDVASVEDVNTLKKEILQLKNELVDLRNIVDGYKKPAVKDYYNSKDYGNLLGLNPKTITDSYFNICIKCEPLTGSEYYTTSEEYFEVERIVNSYGKSGLRGRKI